MTTSVSTAPSSVSSRRETFVYCVLADEFVKIGISGSFEYRLGAIRTNIPFDTEVLCFLPDGSAHKEKKIHRILQPFWEHGEWFCANSDVIDEMRAAKDTNDLISRLEKVIHTEV